LRNSLKLTDFARFATLPSKPMPHAVPRCTLRQQGACSAPAIHSQSLDWLIQPVKQYMPPVKPHPCIAHRQLGECVQQEAPIICSETTEPSQTTQQCPQPRESQSSCGLLWPASCLSQLMHCSLHKLTATVFTALADHITSQLMLQAP
jgi:hypothetical protein